MLLKMIGVCQRNSSKITESQREVRVQTSVIFVSNLIFIASLDRIRRRGERRWGERRWGERGERKREEKRRYDERKDREKKEGMGSKKK